MFAYIYIYIYIYIHNNYYDSGEVHDSGSIYAYLIGYIYELTIDGESSGLVYAYLVG